MNTQELFEWGVTPLSGSSAGKRFKVRCIMKDSLLVIPWDAVEEDTNVQSIKNGTYQIWQPEKTLFESDEIQSNWGNLKKAAKMAGVSDDTKIVLSDLSFGGYFSPFSTHEAAFRLKSFPGSDEKVIVVC